MMRRAPWLSCLRSKPLSSTTSAKRTPHQIPPLPPCAPSPPFSPRTETGKSLNLEERARGVHTHTRTKEVCVSASFARAPPPRTPHERRARRAQAPGTRDRALLLAPGALPRERRPGAKKRERGLGFCLPSQGDPPAFAPLSLSLATVSRSLPPLRALVTRPLVVLLWACRHAARGVVAKKRGRSRERGARLSLLLSRPPHSFSLRPPSHSARACAPFNRVPLADDLCSHFHPPPITRRLLSSSGTRRRPTPTDGARVCVTAKREDSEGGKGPGLAHDGPISALGA